MTPEQLAALKEVAEKPDIKSWRQGGKYWNDKTVADSHGDTFIADCGSNARSSDVAGFIAAFNPTTCLALLEEVERLTKKIGNLSGGIERANHNASLMGQQIITARERSPEYDHRDKT